MPNRRQVFNWINAGPVPWRIYAALGRDELTSCYYECRLLPTIHVYIYTLILTSECLNIYTYIYIYISISTASETVKRYVYVNMVFSVGILRRVWIHEYHIIRASQVTMFLFHSICIFIVPKTTQQYMTVSQNIYMIEDVYISGNV